jgi:formate dehydrogenase subunit beta
MREYWDRVPEERVAVTCKPCDAKAIIELAKREQLDLDDIILIGLNCSGTVSPAAAKEMFGDVFDVDPDNVIREDIEEGELTVTLKDGRTETRKLSELEKQGHGLRESCRRCDTNIPRMADLACGKWGADEGATFIEVCSERGSEILDKAVDGGFISVNDAEEEAIQEREEKNRAERERVREQQERDLDSVMGMEDEERLQYWLDEFDECIKCYGCRDACPLCYCEECILEPSRDFIESGEIPPDTLFPLTRLSHVADSCVNCGQCQDACPMDLPLTKLYTVLNNRLRELFRYSPGGSVEDEPPLATMTQKELRIDDTSLDFSALKDGKAEP